MRSRPSLRVAVAATAAAGFVFLAGCGESPELERAWQRGQQDCFEWADSAESYEICKEDLHAWLDNPEENVPPPFLPAD